MWLGGHCCEIVFFLLVFVLVLLRNLYCKGYFIHYDKHTTTVPQSIWLVDFCRGLHLNFPVWGSLNLPMRWDVFWPISGPLNWQVMNTTAWPSIRQKILAKRNSSWPVTFPCASFHEIPKLKHSCWAIKNGIVRGHPSEAWPPSP